MPKFIHLHTHSHYSLLDGLAKIDDLLNRAEALGMDAIALTDHGNLYGAIEFYKKAKERNIKPILGVEAYVAPNGYESKRPKLDEKRFHLTILAKNNAGWRNLIKLVTKSYLEGFYYKPRMDKKILEEHKEGLIILSGCFNGEISRNLTAKNFDEARRVAKWYQEIFSGDFYLEVQPHMKKLLPQFKVLSAELGIPLVATQDVHYILPEDKTAHEVLLAVQTSNRIDSEDRMTMKDHDLSLKSGEEMMMEFQDSPEAVENTVKIAAKCDMEIKLHETKLPKFPKPEGKTSDEYLWELAYERLPARFPKTTKEVKERLEHELSVIVKTGFADYFLIVADIVEWAKAHSIIVGPGRGSAASSLVSYVLGITNIDPLKYDLLFERFLNPERNEMPDIDIDFTDTRRDEVLAYVREKYGADKFAQIITFGTMMARAAIRDAGRALGYSYGFCDQIAKLIPFNSTIKEALEKVPELKTRYSAEPDARKLIDSARKLEGVARHASVHACGVVISPEPLTNHVPLQKAPQGETAVITQFEMHSIENLGLLKMDFLGLKNLTIIEKTLRLVAENKGERIDIEKISLDDGKTFELFRSAETTGVFQLESDGMRRYLKALKPTELEDIIVMISLYRPGPMELIPHYIRRKHGREEIIYIHPRLEPILKSTYGVGVYQEQMMRIARDLAGFTLAEADTLRKAIGKKIKKLLDEQKEKLVSGMISRGIDEKTAKQIWELFPPFARYGFNRCLTGDTKIYDAESGQLVKIKDVCDGKVEKPKVVSLSEKELKLKTQSATKVFHNGKKKVWQLTTRSGRRIKATANHPFFTPTGWQTLGNLKPGAKVAVPRNLPEPSSPVSATKNKLGLLGYLLAEGNFCHPHGFYFYSKSEEEVKDYLTYLESFKNTVGKVDRSKPAIAVYSKREKVNLPSEAVEWINSLGLRYKKATEKFFPAFVFRLPVDDLAFLIAKMFQGDGCINNKRDAQIFYATSSEKIALGLQHFLLRFGILSTVHLKKFKYRNTVKTGYTVTVSRHGNIKKFIDVFSPYFIGEKSKVAAEILKSHPVINGKLQPWSARGSFDTIPVELVREKMRETVTAGGAGFKEFERQHNMSWRLFMNDKRKEGYLRETVERIAQITRSEELSRHAESDIYWDRVKSIEYKGMEETYDLTVPKDHNFVANDIIVHNSHAASYAMISYQTAYLKARYPVEFMTSLLNVSGTDVNRINFLVNEAKRLKIRVLPPDVNASMQNFSTDEENIRFGLLAIKNLGANIVDEIINERSRGGPFENLTDFLSRIHHRDLNKKSLESLVKSGALDSLGAPRNDLLFNLEDLVKFNQASRKDKSNGQNSLFGASNNLTKLKLKPSEGEIGADSALAWEKELLGLYLTGHPLDAYLPKIKGKFTPIKKATSAAQKENAPRLRLAGVISGVQKIFTKNGQPMLFVTLEDLSDNLEVLVFSETLAKTEIIWQPNKAVIVEGRVSWKNGGPKFIANAVKELR